LGIPLPAVPKIAFVISLFFLLTSSQLIGQEDFDFEVYGAFVSDKNTTVSWKVVCSAPDSPSGVVVRYNRSAVLANEGEVWLHTDTVPYAVGSLELEDLYNASGYIYQVGFIHEGATSNGEIQWTVRDRFETKMRWGITRFLLMVGSLCLFIYGMKTMSEGIQASAGGKLRSTLGSMTNNRFKFTIG
jgi:hypothetical protein